MITSCYLYLHFGHHI